MTKNNIDTHFYPTDMKLLALLISNDNGVVPCTCMTGFFSPRMEMKLDSKLQLTTEQKDSTE